MVLLRKVNNADAGTTDLLGGNDTDKIADYFNDVNVSETPRINTPTEYRSGILNVRDGSNAFNVTVKSATQTADRDFTLPAFIGNDSPACLGLNNIFTAAQQITLDADTLLNLYRPVSTTNSLNSIAFFHRNSSNASVNYASQSSQVITNTAGLEDGKLKWFVKKGGVLTEVMSLDKNGLLTCASISAGGAGVSLSNANTWTAIQTFSLNNALPIAIYRTVNTVGNLTGISFDLQNASSAQKTYGQIQSKIITNTAGSEAGSIVESVMKAGTVTAVRTIDSSGNMTIGSAQNILVGGVLVNTGVIVTTASTSAEFDLINYSVPGNLLGANGCVRVTISGYTTQNQATGTDYTLKVKFGGTIIFEENIATGIVQSAINRPFFFHLLLGNANATNAQTGSGFFKWQDTGGVTTGEGDLGDDESQVNANFRTTDPAKDTTSAQTLQVTMTQSVSSASVITSVRRRLIEYLPGT